jgi:hypothetical protein
MTKQAFWTGDRTEKTMTTKTTLTCGYHTIGSWSRHGCGRPVPDDGMAVEERPWNARADAPTYVPLCNRHVAVENRKRYGQRKIVAITPDVRASIEADRAAAAKADAERRAEREAEAAKRTASYTAAEQRETHVEYAVVRDDKQGDLLWDRSADAPTYGPSVPRWLVQPTDGTRRVLGTISVEIDEEYGERRITFHNVNTLTPKAAVALSAAIIAALAEL